jgi:hypothetical protein
MASSQTAAETTVTAVVRVQRSGFRRRGRHTGFTRLGSQESLSSHLKVDKTGRTRIMFLSLLWDETK